MELGTVWFWGVGLGVEGRGGEGRGGEGRGGEGRKGEVSGKRGGEEATIKSGTLNRSQFPSPPLQLCLLPLPPNILCLRTVHKNRIEYYITSSSQDFLAETRGRCCEKRNLEVCRGMFASYYHGMIYSIIFYLMLKSSVSIFFPSTSTCVMAFTRNRLSNLLFSGSHYCP